MSKYEITWFELKKIMSEFCGKLGDEYDEMSIEEFEDWSESNYEDVRTIGKMYLEKYCDEATGKETTLFNETELNEDQLRQAVNWKEAQIDSSGGRPSKVDKWEEMIVDGAATLEDAREEMSDPTWYKLRERIHNYRAETDI